MPQNSLEFGLLVLVAQLVLIAGALGFCLWRGARQRERSQTRDASALVAKVAGANDGRRAALLMIFTETYDFGAEEAEQTVSDFIERERAFYNTMLDIHLGRGGKSLTDIPTELTMVVSPWLRLLPKNTGAIAGAATTLENTPIQSPASSEGVLEESTLQSADFIDEQPVAPPTNAVTEPTRTQAPSGGGSAALRAKIEVPSPVSQPVPVPPIREPAGEVIALDMDLDETIRPVHGSVSTPLLSPTDLDSLMENLDEEYTSAAA